MTKSPTYPLANVAERERRRNLLQAPHMKALTAFVARMRREMQGYQIPDFDPEDGGVHAEVLFLLKSPGSGATESWFVSRDNPDRYARLGAEVNNEAGLDRKSTVSWNVVPWVSKSRLDSVLVTEATRALPYLNRLLAPRMLPRLKWVVLFGSLAAMFRRQVEESRRGIQVVSCRMPSPEVFNTMPGSREAVVGTLRHIARSI